MRTRWSIANIKHSLVIVFSIAFCCLSYNIPLRLSDSILLRLPATTDCFSTLTHEKPFIDLYRKSRAFPLQIVGKLKYIHFYSLKRENFLLWDPFLESTEGFSGHEKPFIKLRFAYSGKLVFLYVEEGIKISITGEFGASRRLCFEDIKELCHSKNTRNVSGLSRNGRLEQRMAKRAESVITDH